MLSNLPSFPPPKRHRARTFFEQLYASLATRAGAGTVPRPHQDRRIHTSTFHLPSSHFTRLRARFYVSLFATLFYSPLLPSSIILLFILALLHFSYLGSSLLNFLWQQARPKKGSPSLSTLHQPQNNFSESQVMCLLVDDVVLEVDRPGLEFLIFSLDALGFDFGLMRLTATIYTTWQPRNSTNRFVQKSSQIFWLVVCL